MCNYIESMCSLVVASANSKSTAQCYTQFTYMVCTKICRAFDATATATTASFATFVWLCSFAHSVRMTECHLSCVCLGVCKFKMTMISFSFGYFIGLQCWIFFFLTVILSSKLNNSKRPVGLKFIQYTYTRSHTLHTI